jgi:hypothetical protein
MTPTPFTELPDSVKNDIIDNLHDLFFSATDITREVLRGVVDDMNPELPLGDVPLAPLVRQVKPPRQISPGAVNVLKLRLSRSPHWHGTDLFPILVSNGGGKLEDGGHRVMAYDGSNRTKIPAVDITVLLNADWEKEFNEPIPGLKKAKNVKEAADDILNGTDPRAVLEMTEEEHSADWAERNKVEIAPDGDWIVYHATPKASEIRSSGFFEKGTNFETSAKDALRFFQGRRVAVLRVKVDPRLLSKTVWLVARERIPIREVSQGSGRV